MRATLSFRLPEEELEHECALRAQDTAAVIRDLDAWLRQQIDHTDRDDKAALQECLDKLWVLVGSHDVARVVRP